MRISVIDGDIAQEHCDAMIVGINNTGLWFGALDGVIQRYAGSQYHDQVADALSMDRTIETFVATGHDSPHLGSFGDIVFVIDMLDEPLNVIVRRGLTVASDRGYRTVAMPLIRFGVLRDVGGTDDQKLDDIVMGITGFASEMSSRIDELKVVVYGDTVLSAKLRDKLDA